MSWHTRPGLSGCIAVEYRWKRKTRNINPVLARSIFSPLNLPIGRSSRIYLLLTVIFGFVRGGLIIAQAYYLSLVISGFFLGGYTLDKLRNQVPIILGIVLARAGLAYFSEVMAQQGSSTIKSGIRNHLALHLMELGPAFVQQERTGELVTTAMQGVESLEVYFSQYLPQLFLAILVPAAILCFVFPMDVLTGLVFLLTAPLIPIFMVLIASQSEAATKRQWTQLARLSAYFLDALQGLVPVKLLGRSQDRIAGISRSSEQYRSVTMNVLRITFLSALVLELVGTISIAVVAVEIGLRLLNGGMVYREALFILILAPEFYMPLRLLGMRFHAAMPAMSAAERIKEILETRWLRSAGNAGTPALHHTCPEPQVLGTQSGASAARQGRGDKKPLAPEGLPGEAIDKLCIQSDTPYGLHWRNNRALPDIRFEDVHFSYPEGEDTVRPALHGISFTIQPGQRLAIVGPSCAGKSTLMALLLRFVEPTQGRIMVGNLPLQDVPAKEWRECIAWVPQQPFLFNDTLEKNLLFGKPGASRKEIEAAVRQAHLDRFIQSLHEGYATPVGEQGIALSGGQAQRLALARAFLKPATLLLMDEPAANLDPEHEALVQASVRKLGIRKTVVTIAHRLETVINADNILVLDAGRIVESGNHRDLLAEKGLYYRMVQKNETARE